MTIVLPFDSRLRALLGSALTLLSMSGCVMVPAGHHAPVYRQPAPVYSPGGHDDGTAVVIAPAAPPPPRMEVVPVMPFVGALWIGGYWNWVGHRHVWVPGHWSAPRPGYRYEPRRWAPQGHGWGLQGGWRGHH